MVSVQRERESYWIGGLQLVIGSPGHAMPSNRRCIYCGRCVKLTREHIVPDSLGATKWTKSVCAGCNSQVLSAIDKELAEKSPLSLVAAIELQKKMQYAWDVDHEDNNLLLEADADDQSQSMTLWPQMVFEEYGPELRGDAEEIQIFGWEDFQTQFVRHMLAAFGTVKSGASRPRIVFERMSADIPGIYRYAPRVFATRRIAEFSNRMRFQCRYRYHSDKQRVLRELDNWDNTKRFVSRKVGLGSSLPAFKSNYELTATLRALFKIAINLLHWTCDKTSVDRASFKRPVKVVTGERPVDASLLLANGFVHAEDVVPLGCPPGEHRFRLVYDDRRAFWNCYSAFFGGRVGASVRFPGPCKEQWCTADVAAPIGSNDWTVQKSSIYQPLRVRIEWADLGKIIPSVPFINSMSTVSVVRRTNA